MPEPAEAKSCPVLEALQAATEDDLVVIDTRIRDLEDELEKTTDRVKCEVASLRAARRLIELRLYGEPSKQPRGPRQPVAGNGSTNGGRAIRGNRRAFVEQHTEADDHDRLSVRVVKLIQAQGPMAIQVIANRLEEPLQAVAVAVVHCAKLKRDGDKVSLVQSLLPEAS
jgi:hypothetical protein